MHEYIADRLVRIGLGILVIGSGPLLAIILLAGNRGLAGP